ncbi:Protein CBG21447 [Caenorhabditis briggsae]|uniref:Protein CBG21447 n=1 Tax=Caenorhabditis briggsae TaxID=6238 RepID=A8Y027_CAEBR|nr:Protein CBG21447 [Caenorhabditis briggsae]CAP38245.2 Protein CBG21447 [Caenorhabditis briggsae]
MESFDLFYMCAAIILKVLSKSKLCYEDVDQKKVEMTISQVSCSKRFSWSMTCFSTKTPTQQFALQDMWHLNFSEKYGAEIDIWSAGIIMAGKLNGERNNHGKTHQKGETRKDTDPSNCIATQ